MTKIEQLKVKREGSKIFTDTIMHNLIMLVYKKDLIKNNKVFDYFIFKEGKINRIVKSW